MKYLLLCYLLALPTLMHAQQKTLNVQLKHELDSIYVLDQFYRNIQQDPSKGRQRDSVVLVRHFPQDKAGASLVKLMVETDSSNLNRVRAIITRYGYPGKSMVGAPTNEAAFWVLQHSTRINQYFPLIRQAAQDGEIPFAPYAKMLDRQLMSMRKAQHYGTSAQGYLATNKTTGAAEWKYFVWPIQNPAHVNERRKKAGITETVEAFAKRIGCEYQPLTLAQAEKLLAQQPQSQK